MRKGASSVHVAQVLLGPRGALTGPEYPADQSLPASAAFVVMALEDTRAVFPPRAPASAARGLRVDRLGGPDRGPKRREALGRLEGRVEDPPEEVVEGRVATRQLVARVPRGLGETTPFHRRDERLVALREVLVGVARRVVVEAAALGYRLRVEPVDLLLERHREPVAVHLVAELVRERVEGELRGLAQLLDARRRMDAADAAQVRVPPPVGRALRLELPAQRVVGQVGRQRDDVVKRPPLDER